ncbi:hypothetical protein DMENIID0001_154580 [Sergentomyia squamirostris]
MEGRSNSAPHLAKNTATTRNPLLRVKNNVRRNLSLSFEEVGKVFSSPFSGASGHDAGDIELQLKSMSIDGKSLQQRPGKNIQWMESSSEGEILDQGPKLAEKTSLCKKCLRM